MILIYSWVFYGWQNSSSGRILYTLKDSRKITNKTRYSLRQLSIFDVLFNLRHWNLSIIYLVCHIFKGCLAYVLLIVVEIDKKIRFHKVLGLEYMMKMKKYSNTEYLVKSWIMIIIGIVALIVAFFQTIYNALNNVGAITIFVVHLIYFLAPTGAQEMLIFVRLFIHPFCSKLYRALILHILDSDLLVVSQQSVSSHSSVSQSVSHHTVAAYDTSWLRLVL